MNNWIKRFKAIHLILIVTAISFKVAANYQCTDLFAVHELSRPNNIFKSSIPLEVNRVEKQIARLDEYLNPKFEADTFMKKDHLNKTTENVQNLIHEVIEKKYSPAEISQIVNYCEKNLGDRSLSFSRYGDNAKTILYDIIELLKLVNGSLDDWKSYLINEFSFASTSGYRPFNTANLFGYVLIHAPEATKNLLLEFLGKNYFSQYKSNVVSVIHLLLDPVKMYNKFKLEKKSDLEFYNAYLKLIHSKVFSNEKRINQYDGQIILKIAETLQKYLHTQPDKTAINFFGSVPNGFATHQSDLDIFNHFDTTDNVDVLREAQRQGLEPEDYFSQFRYQIDDPQLALMLHPVLAEGRVNWSLENTGEKAHEHFGSMGHVFSLHITKTTIVLRLYTAYSKLNKRNSDGAWDYIELHLK